MFEKAKNEGIPIFVIGKIRNSNVWKRQNSQFQCLEKEKSRIPILELPKFRIPMFEKAKIHYSNLWKSQSSQLQCLKKLKLKNSNVCNSQNSQFQFLEKAKNIEFQCLE